MARPTKSYTAREKTEGRCFTAILYSLQSESGEDFGAERLRSYWTRYYLICHDHDIWTDEDIDEWIVEHPSETCPYQPGDPKKIHYHLVGYSESPCMLGRAAAKFGCPSNFVKRVKSVKAMLRYLVHLDHPNKYQYDASEVITNDEKYYDYLKNEMDINMKAQVIMDYISADANAYLTIDSVSRYCIQKGCWDEFRRGQHLFIALIREHNYKCDTLKRRVEHQHMLDDMANRLVWGHAQTVENPDGLDFKTFVQEVLSECMQ